MGAQHFSILFLFKVLGNSNVAVASFRLVIGPGLATYPFMPAIAAQSLRDPAVLTSKWSLTAAAYLRITPN
jgi:hypothetical protein